MTKLGTVVHSAWMPYLRDTDSIFRDTSCTRPNTEASTMRSMLRTRPIRNENDEFIPSSPIKEVNTSLLRIPSITEVVCQYMGPHKKLIKLKEAPRTNPSLGPLNGGNVNFPV
eukprot:scaffold16276_cov49-Cyclotella_meneghiniana.AAC.1